MNMRLTTRSFKTAKGTELPIQEIHGKDYLLVPHRVIWFREEHPDWSIETEVKPHGDSCLSRATIKDSQGRIIAVAHKFEDSKGFKDFIEKSETGAIGRALALCGYGTQFTMDLDEGSERLADAPMSNSKSPSSGPIKPIGTDGLIVKPISSSGGLYGATGYVFKAGKNKGRGIKEVPEEQIIGYRAWASEKLQKGESVPQSVKDDLQACNDFLAAFHKPLLEQPDLSHGDPGPQDEDIPF